MSKEIEGLVRLDVPRLRALVSRPSLVREEVQELVILAGRACNALESQAQEIGRLQDERGDAVEEIEYVHGCLTNRGVPTMDEHAAYYSLWGRVQRYVEQALRSSSETA